MKWQVFPEEAGLELFIWLQRRLPSAPPSYLRQLLKGGRITVGTEVGCAGLRLAVGEEVRLPRSERLQQLVEATPELRILAQTREYLVVEKPAGLPVHRSSSGGDNLADRVRDYLHLAGAEYRVAPAHRLDAGSSGAVLFGKGKQALRRLGELFMAGEVSKQYLALAAGQLTGCGELTSPVTSHGKAREALTRWQELRNWDGASLLLVTLGSGRRHQIRCQLAAAGHPLAGDRRYRSSLLPDLPRLFLHHCRLFFTDPWSGRPVRIISPLPGDLRQVLSCLGGCQGAGEIPLAVRSDRL